MTIFIKPYIFVKVREGTGREGREGKGRTGREGKGRQGRKGRKGREGKEGMLDSIWGCEGRGRVI